MRKTWILVIIVAAGAWVAPAAADEIDDLVARLKPPARFVDYRPDFRVEKRTFTFHHVKGPEQKVWRLVMDGQKYVALVRAGDLNMLALTPDDAKTTLRMPTGRYHLDTIVGPTLPTHPFIQAKINYTLQGESNIDETDSWEGGGQTLTLVRRSRTDSREVTNTLVFGVDPVHGYVVDGTYQSAFKEKPSDKTKFAGGTFCPGNYVPWPEKCVYERTVYCPDGTTDYVGWANNLLAMDRADGNKDRFTWRDGGFIAYLDTDTGWSPCRTRDDGAPPPRMSLCNAHNDFHVGIPMPDVRPDAGGWYRYRFHHRLLPLPPELTRHVWDRMKLNNQGQTAVIIRIGDLEDFEDQPVDLTRPLRGLVWTSGGPRLAADEAHSGKQSLLLERTAWPNLPQVSLEPNARYRLEAWLKVEGEGAEAYVKGDFYEWSPHSRNWLREQQTTHAKAGEGWTHVVLDFDTPDWDPFINVVFCVEGDGRAWLDDFRLSRIEEEN